MARLLPTGLAALAALAVWLSLGVQAVVDASTSARVGALPPWWFLAVLEGLLVGAVLIRRMPASRLWPLALSALVCLPWLPGRIPPAFLIWYGPMAGLVWLTVMLGLAGPLVRERLPSAWIAKAARSAWLCAALAAVAFAMGAWALRARIPAGDEPHYLIITQSLLGDGDLRIENNHQRGDYFPYHATELRPDYIQRGQDGQIYSIHAPGISVVVAPAFALAGWPGAVVSVVLLASLAAWLLWRAIWELTDSAAAAWIGASAFAFSAPGYFHGFTIFPDGAGAVPVAATVWALVRLDRGRALSIGALIVIGIGLAALPWLHTRFALTAGALGLVLLLRLWPRPDRVRVVAAFLAIPAASALAWFSFFWAIWGTPSPAAPYGGATQSAWAHVLPGVPGLLADQHFGLIPNAPIYGAALLGLLTLARWRRRLALEIALVFGTYLFAVATYRMWWGGFSAPGRFLVSVLPLLSVPLAAAWIRGSAGRRALLLLLLTVGIAMVTARVAVEAGALLYNERDGYDRLLEWANRSVSLPLAWPSLHRDAVGEAARDIAIWVVALGASAGAGAALTRRLGQAWTLAAAAMAAAVMLAAALTWPGRAASIVETTSALDLLQQWPTRPLAVGWQSRPFGAVPLGRVQDTLVVGSGGRVSGSTQAPPLFLAPMVPAGAYRLHTEGGRPQGRLSIRAGDAPADLDEFDLERLPDGAVLELPVRLRSLRIQGEDLARPSVGRVTLRPVSQSAPPGRAWIASRAVRYRSLRVFFLDDEAFAEPGGFWTVGSETTDVFLDHGHASELASGPRALTLRAGAVGVRVTLTSGAWQTRVTLEPGETANVPLPDPVESGWLLRIQTEGGFRPAQHAPRSGDWRHLGVWIEPGP